MTARRRTAMTATGGRAAPISPLYLPCIFLTLALAPTLTLTLTRDSDESESDDDEAGGGGEAKAGEEDVCTLAGLGLDSSDEEGADGNEKTVCRLCENPVLMPFS